MRGFLYFVPDQRVAFTLDRIKEIGLGYVFDAEGDWIERQVNIGPEGLPGRVLARRDWIGNRRAELLGYFPERQEWIREPGDAEYLCGVDPDDLPNPDDLARKGNLVSGSWIVLDDDQRWLAPIAIRFQETEQGEGERVCNLPLSLSWSDEVQAMAPSGNVARKYRSLWRLAMRYYDASGKAFREASEFEQNVEFPFPEGDQLCVLSMQANYRISIPEVTHLGIWNQQTQKQILHALLDNETWYEWIKKKLPPETK